MDRLWAPWRMEYIRGQNGAREPVKAGRVRRLKGAERGCFLCEAAASPLGTVEEQAAGDRARLVALRTERSVIVANRFPYNNGHLMVCPRRHAGELGALAPAERDELGRLLVLVTSVVQREMGAKGFNVGLNLGAAAGAGVPGHLHWHVVPRWEGDQNFMPVTGGTRVLPEALVAMLERVGPALVAAVAEIP